MSENISQEILNQLKATNGQVITCKAAVAWEPKKPLDITDIQVSILFLGTFNEFFSKVFFFCETAIYSYQNCDLTEKIVRC